MGAFVYASSKLLPKSTPEKKWKKQSEKVASGFCTPQDIQPYVLALEEVIALGHLSEKLAHASVLGRHLQTKRNVRTSVHTQV